MSAQGTTSKPKAKIMHAVCGSSIGNKGPSDLVCQCYVEAHVVRTAALIGYVYPFIRSMAPLSGCLKTSETDLIPSIASLQSCPNLLVVIGDHAYSLGSASRAKSTMRILGRQMAGDLVANVGQKTVVLVLPVCGISTRAGAVGPRSPSRR